MGWQSVSHNIIRHGRAYSTKSLQPTPQDIDHILSLTGGDCIIARKDKPSLEFIDNEFVGTGDFWIDEELPPDVTHKDAEYLWWMQDEFSVTELAEKMYPGLCMYGQGSRHTEDKWRRHPGSPPDEDWEEYNFRKMAVARVSSFVYGKARDNNWIESTGYGTWKKTF